MEEIIYRVYILRDKNNCITDVWSTGNIALGDTRTEEEMMELGYIKIDEGSDGTIYGHAQPNYLLMKYGKPTYDERNRSNFKYIGRVIALTEEEKTVFFPPSEDYSKEKLLWSGALPKGQSVKINGLENFNTFKINAGSVGEIVVSRQNVSDKRFNANSSSTNAGVYYFRFINITVDLETGTITNDGCYYTSIQNVATSPTKFENITEIWGIE